MKQGIHHKIFSFIIILLLISNKAYSCQCLNSNFDVDFAYSTHIFSGIIISKEKNISNNKGKSFYPPVKYRMIVKDSWKGKLNDTIDLYSGIGGPDCGFQFEVNKTYMVWASIDQYGLLYTDRCGRTNLLDDSPDLDWLNHKCKGLAYDSIYLTNNEIRILKERMNVKSMDLSKTALFLRNDKILYKKQLIDALVYRSSIEFITFPADKLKLLPDKATNGALFIKDYYNQKIKMRRIIKTIKKSNG